MRKQVLNILIICAGILGLAATAQAAETTDTTGLKANASVTSNYVFRGETQTDDGPAIQGGIDYTHSSGFYAGAWGSNVKFPNAGGSTLEYDLYAGMNFPINQAVKMDVGYIMYSYLDGTVNDHKGAGEVFVGAKWMGLSGYYYHGNAKNNTYNSDYQYFDVRYTLPLAQDFKLTLHYGHLDPNSGSSNDDASVRIGKNFYGYDTSLTLTTVSHDNGGGSKSRLFITVTKYFDL